MCMLDCVWPAVILPGWGLITGSTPIRCGQHMDSLCAVCFSWQ